MKSGWVLQFLNCLCMRKKEPSQEKGSMSFNVISSLNSLVNGKLVGLVPINSN